MPNQSIDLTPYLFLAMMIIAGGVVAWVADGMGRKIGKKRLSFMGLRPRHTATLITVGAGVLIPILTIAFIYASSSDVREWIREGRGAIKRAHEYQEKADEAQKQVSELEIKQKAQQESIRKQTEQARKLNEKLKLYEGKVALAGQRLNRAESLTKVAQSRVTQIQGKLTQTNKQITAKEKEISKTLALLTTKKNELGRLRSTFNTASTQLVDINKRALDLDRQNETLEKKLGTLQQDLSSLQTQKVQFETQIDSYKDSIKTYQDSIADYGEKVKALAEELEKQRAELRTNIVASRTRPMIFEAGQELARIQLPPSLSPVAAKTAYFDLLQRTRAVASARKALNIPTSASAGLYARSVQGRVVSVEEQENALIRAITSQRNEIVLISRSFFNAFEGEYVLVDFIAYRNRLVYPQDKLIVEKRIDGRKSEVEILNQIQDFISTTVRAQALKDGMIPPSGRAGKLGDIGEEELLDLIREVKSFNQLVRLQALAKEDTNAGDQLNLTFRVRL
jgi:uncharacterized protein (DUF3084 family)